MTYVLTIIFKDTNMRKDKNVKPRLSGKEYMLILLDLFWTFFKIGITSFGGGYTMVSLIEREVVGKKQWLGSEDMLNIFAIAETTPGPISINTSTYVGYHKAGVVGAAASTLGVVLPSFIIIFVISFFIEFFQTNLWLGYALKGMRIGALALILGAVLNMYKKIEKTIFGLIILAFTFLITLFTDFSIIYTLLICAAVGIIYCFIVRLVKYIKEVNL